MQNSSIPQIQKYTSTEIHRIREEAHLRGKYNLPISKTLVIELKSLQNLTAMITKMQNNLNERLNKASKIIHLNNAKNKEI